MGKGWHSPDGNGGDAGWYFLDKAYDDSVGTEAFTYTTAAWGTWSFSTPVADVDVIGIYCRGLTGYPFSVWNPNIVIELYYNGGWHEVWSGVVTKSQWKYIIIERLAYAVSEARTKCLTAIGGMKFFFVGEIKIGRSARIVSETPVPSDDEENIQLKAGLFIKLGGDCYANYADFYLGHDNPPVTFIERNENPLTIATSIGISENFAADYYWQVKLANDVNADVAEIDAEVVSSVFHYRTHGAPYNYYQQLCRGGV